MTDELDDLYTKMRGAQFRSQDAIRAMIDATDAYVATLVMEIRRLRRHEEIRRERKAARKPTRGKPVIVDDAEYCSALAAHRITGVSYGKLLRLADKQFMERRS